MPSRGTIDEWVSTVLSRPISSHNQTTNLSWWGRVPWRRSCFYPLFWRHEGKVHNLHIFSSWPISVQTESVVSEGVGREERECGEMIQYAPLWSSPSATGSCGHPVIARSLVWSLTPAQIKPLHVEVPPSKIPTPPLNCFDAAPFLRVRMCVCVWCPQPQVYQCVYEWVSTWFKWSSQWEKCHISAFHLQSICTEAWSLIVEVSNPSFSSITPQRVLTQFNPVESKFFSFSWCALD